MSWILDIVQCPHTAEPLRVAEAGLVQQLERQGAVGKLCQVDGEPVKACIEGGLVNQSGTYFYPRINGYYPLLREAAIRIDPPSRPTDSSSTAS